MSSRSPNGTGTIYRRKDGRFEGAAYITTPAGIRRRARVYGATHKKTQDALNTLLKNERQGIPTATSSLTVAGYLDHWLTENIARHTRPLTFRSYESMVRLYLNPLLGNKKLTGLTVSNVQDAIDTLIRDGHSPRTIQKARSVLRSALSSAMRGELVFRNVAKLVELPTWERKRIEPWTEDEARTFLTASQDHMWSVAFLLLLTYGMREGEVLGLTWNDIDFVNNVFHVRQQVQRIDGALRAVPVKTTCGKRTLPLVPRVRAALLHVAEQRGIDIDTSRIPETPTGHSTHDLVVTSKTGGPVEAQNLLRAFRTLTKHANLRPITIHHTRHTAATLLGSLGVPARDVQLILGHANIITTQQIYQHGNREVHRQAITAIDNALTTPKSVLDRAGTGSRCRQLLPSNPTQNITPPEKQKPLPKTTEVDANNFGGSSQTRTGDTRLFRPLNHALAHVPTSVINALHSDTHCRLMGLVAVKHCRQTVTSPVTSTDRLEELRVIRAATREALSEHLRRRCFPHALLTPPASRQRSQHND